MIIIIDSGSIKNTVEYMLRADKIKMSNLVIGFLSEPNSTSPYCFDDISIKGFCSWIVGKYFRSVFNAKVINFVDWDDFSLEFQENSLEMLFGVVGRSIMASGHYPEMFDSAKGRLCVSNAVTRNSIIISIERY